MHGLGLIRPLTWTERQNLERLHKGCEAPGCPKQPECAITLYGPYPEYALKHFGTELFITKYSGGQRPSATTRWNSRNLGA